MTQKRRWTLGGGLASGKSAVRKMLSDAGVFTIDADRIGHEILAQDGPAYELVAAQWPQTVVSGVIDRSKLAEVVFSDSEELKVLEAITHPVIFDRVQSMVEEFDGVVVVEIPVLTHGLGGRWGSIVVDSRDEVRLARAVARGMTTDDALARMRSQPSRKRWLSEADVVIPNHGSVESLVDAVDRIVSDL